MLIADYSLKIVNLLIGRTLIMTMHDCKNVQRIELLKAIKIPLISLETLICIIVLAPIVKLMD